MVTPGLLPETGDRRPTPLKWILSAVILVFLILVGVLVLQLTRLRAERDTARARVEELLQTPKRPAPPAPADPADLQRRLDALEARVRQLEGGTRPEGSPGGGRAPDLRVSDDSRHELELARIRMLEARVETRRMLAGLMRGQIRDAMLSLSAALASDPLAFRNVKPRDFLERPGDLEKVIADLEKRVRDNPLDADAKVLLAYLYYHEKGAGYAKALLLEVLAAAPDHPDARAFLDVIDK